jgi:hypothetical protein
MALQIRFYNGSGSTLNWYCGISNKGAQSGVLQTGRQVIVPVPSGIESVGWLTSGNFTGIVYWGLWTGPYAFVVVASKQRFRDAAAIRASLGDAGGGEEMVEVAAAKGRWQNNSRNTVQWASALVMGSQVPPNSSIEIPLPGDPNVDVYGWQVSGFSGRLLRQLNPTNVNYQWTVDNRTS